MVKLGNIMISLIIILMWHIFLLYKAEKPSVRLSDRHAAISVMSASIETGHARNES